MTNLASTYCSQGHWKEAEELELQILATKRRTPGEANPSTLSLMGNLAIAYRNLGWYSDAEEPSSPDAHVEWVIFP